MNSVTKSLSLDRNIFLSFNGNVVENSKENDIRQKFLEKAIELNIKVKASEFMREIINFKLLKGINTCEEMQEYFDKNQITGKKFESLISENILIRKVKSLEYDDYIDLKSINLN